MDENRLTLPPLGFGAFKIGRNEGIKYPRGYELPNDADVERLLNDVLDIGITYIDTAPAYGLSEERIGRAIGHRRDEYLLSTKVGERFEDGESTYDYSTEAVSRSVERSLARLRTDVVDLLLVHAHRNDLSVLHDTDVVPAMQQMRERGWVRHLGFSGYTADALQAALPWADAIMVEYHLENRVLEPVITAAAARGVRVIVKKALASGRLEPAEAIRFALSNNAVDAVVVGSLDADHLRDNFRLARHVRHV